MWLWGEAAALNGVLHTGEDTGLPAGQLRRPGTRRNVLLLSTPRRGSRRLPARSSCLREGLRARVRAARGQCRRGAGRRCVSRETRARGTWKAGLCRARPVAEWFLPRPVWLPFL